MIDTLKSILKVYFKDPELLAVLLMGSVSADVHDESSDVDILMIYNKNEPQFSLPNTGWTWDVSYMSKKEFEELSESSWKLPAFMTAKVIYDRTNEWQDKIKKLCTFPKETYTERISSSLDGYLNGFYRSMKAVRRGNQLGALLEAADSINWLVRCLYSMNYSISPYVDRIEATSYLLQDSPLPKEEWCQLLVEILREASPEKQILLYRSVEKLLKQKGFSQIYESWGDDLEKEIRYWENVEC